MARIVGLNSDLQEQLLLVGARPKSPRAKRIAREIGAFYSAGSLPAPEDERIKIEGREAWARRVPNDHVTLVWYFHPSGGEDVQILALVWTRTISG